MPLKNQKRQNYSIFSADVYFKEYHLRWILEKKVRHIHVCLGLKGVLAGHINMSEGNQ